MKKMYSKAEIKLIDLKTEDIMTLSGGTDLEDLTATFEGTITAGPNELPIF